MRLTTPASMRLGNRAVLAQPAPSAPVSIPALFAAQVEACPGCGGNGMR